MDRKAYSAAVLAKRDAIADAARSYDWQGLLPLLERTPALVNSWRVGGTALYTALHQAAHGGAPIEVVERLVAFGAWRTLPTSTGERAVDLARAHGHDHLVELLAPRVLRSVDPAALAQVQGHFHDVIRERVAGVRGIGALRLPELATLTEYAVARCWFPVPGMYGGFKFWLTEGDSPRLVAESWSRVVEGSEQHHEITPGGARLVEGGAG